MKNPDAPATKRGAEEDWARSIEMRKLSLRDVRNPLPHNDGTRAAVSSLEGAPNGGAMINEIVSTAQQKILAARSRKGSGG